MAGHHLIPRARLRPFGERTLAELEQRLLDEGKRCDRTIVDLVESVTGLSDALDRIDLFDGATASVDVTHLDLLNAQLARARSARREVDAALHRFRTGDYGLCTRCGTDVPLERLRALPTARCCVRCS